jgi:hypothetical protein
MIQRIDAGRMAVDDAFLHQRRQRQSRPRRQIKKRRKMVPTALPRPADPNASSIDVMA